MHFSSALARPTSNAIQQSFRLKGIDRSIDPLRLATSSDALPLERISREIAQGSLSVRQILLTTGLGMSAGPELPVRLPSLFLPGLRMMREFQQKIGDSPTYLIYQATDFIAKTNGIPLDLAQRRAEQTKEYILRFIDRFHADVARSVVVRIGEEENPETSAAIHEVSERVRDAAEKTGHGHHLLDQLSSSEEKHSNGRGNHELYAAANVVYNGAHDAHYPYEAVAAESATRAILPIGGNAEKPFFALTSHFAEKMSGRDVIPLLTMLGSRPTYYPYPQHHDPCSLAALADMRLKDHHIRSDLAALENVGANAETLKGIYPERP